MDTLGSRIKALREGLIPTTSQRALGEMCGWEGKSAQARIGNYEKDLREPGIDDLKKLARALGTTVTYLIGETSIAEPNHRVESGEPDPQYAVITQYTATGSAGDGYDNNHVEVKGGLVFKLEWLKRLNLKAENLCVIYAEGMSMEPTITDGDVLLLDSSQREPISGKIYALRRPNGEISIKRLIQTHTHGWIIRSDNRDDVKYPDEPATDTEIGHLQIEGRIVWHAGTL